MAPYQQRTRRRIGEKPGNVPHKVSNWGPAKRVIPNLYTESDNEGTKAWREGKPADSRYDLPNGFDPASSVGVLEMFRYIEDATNTRLQLQKCKNFAVSKVYNVKIWGGTPENVRQALSQLRNYFAQKSGQDKKPAKFSKIESDRGWERHLALHKKMQRDEKRDKFRKKLTENEIAEKRFQYSLVVPWREEHWRIEDVLGQQLEAIDEVRMDGLCYITFSRILNEANFVLLGNHREKMLRAAERLQTIPYCVASHALSPSQLFLFKPVKVPFDYSAFVIKQVDYFKPKYLLIRQEGSSSKEEEKQGKFLLLQPTGVSHEEFLTDEVSAVSSLEDLEVLGPIWLGIQRTAEINAQYLHRWTTAALKHLTIYRGYLQMQVTVGKCVFRRHRHDSELKPSVVEDMLLDANNQDRNLDAFIAASADTVNGSKLLERFISSGSLLTFYDCPLLPNWTPEKRLSTCYPRLRAAFVFGKSPSENIRLEVEYKTSCEGGYEEVSRRWLLLEDGGTVPPYFLDVNMLDLQNPNLSNNLRISRCEILKELQSQKIKDIHRQFANNIKPNPKIKDFNYAENTSLFQFQEDANTCALLDLKFYEQSRSWLFSIGMTGYFAELYASGTMEMKKSRKMLRNQLREAWPRKECWAIRVIHERWGSLFKENEDLGIGKKTNWQPTEAQFFPSENYIDTEGMEGTEAEAGAGFLKLQNIVKIVEDIIEADELRERKVESCNLESTFIPSLNPDQGKQNSTYDAAKTDQICLLD
ncbi:uncharacterized protein PV09_02496 [Verruconis gallopava]|uniref:DUF7905 domain-containing protein n=1 Tax=Verruconis gallopava TaxID=253628 RepID=A0A0D1XVI4_9PEZI|nr:uncharacterized protein PV09_02496 [Verruconis gallopava]KIW06816.1 hypothetical protein PV09_02496 [Verruconis gallopava]